MKEKLLSRIAERKITVGVVGLGYVGLPLAVEKAKAGFRTIGFDVQEEKVNLVNAGHNYIGDVVDAELAQLVRNGTLSATSDFSFIKDVDFVAICVPTPLDVHQEPDISYVESSAKSIAGHLTAGTIVVLESTTYPGTTEELLKPLLEEGSGLKCGTDFYLGFSPERIDPGNLIYKPSNTPKVVGAIGADAVDDLAWERVRRTRFRKNFSLGWRGWADLRLAVADLSRGRVTTNSQGKPLGKTLQANAFIDDGAAVCAAGCGGARDAARNTARGAVRDGHRLDASAPAFPEGREGRACDGARPLFEAQGEKRGSKL